MKQKLPCLQNVKNDGMRRSVITIIGKQLAIFDTIKPQNCVEWEGQMVLLISSECGYRRIESSINLLPQTLPLKHCNIT